MGHVHEDGWSAAVVIHRRIAVLRYVYGVAQNTSNSRQEMITNS